MSVDQSEDTVWSEELYRVLQDLTDDEFKEFKWHLRLSEVLCGYQPINKYKLKKAERWKTVDLMEDNYTPEGALKVTRKVLEKMNRNDLVQKLPAAEANSTEEQTNAEAAAAVVAPHPRQEALSLQQQIISAVGGSREPKGLSRPALRKVLAAKGVDVAKSSKDISTVTSRLVRERTLTETKGGFYRMDPGAEKRATAAAKTAAKKAAAAEKKAAAKRAEAKRAAETATAAMEEKEEANRKEEAIRKAAAAAKKPQGGDSARF